MQNPKFIFPVQAAFIFILLVFSGCGPSPEDNAKTIQAQKQMGLDVYAAHKPEADAYKAKLVKLTSMLAQPDSETVVVDKMSPVLKGGHNHEQPNTMVIKYEALYDTDLVSYSHPFDLNFQGNGLVALDNYRSIRRGDFFSSYLHEEPRKYITKEYFESTVSSLSTEKTPYVLVVREISHSNIVLHKDGYSGGVVQGSAWLVDLRTMEILGSMPLGASPGVIRIDTKGDDFKMQQEASRMSNARIQQSIDDWLKKFPGAEIR